MFTQTFISRSRATANEHRVAAGGETHASSPGTPRLRNLGAGLMLVLASSLACTAGASARTPCAPVGGASPCSYQLQLGEGIDEPARSGQVVQVQSIDPVNFTAGSLASISCPRVTLGGTVTGTTPAGLLNLALTSASFGLENDECGSSLGTVIVGVHGPQKWINVLNAGNDKASISSADEETKIIVYITVTWKRLPGGNELSCTFGTSKIDSRFNANGQAIELVNKATKLSLDKPASDPSCPKSGSLGSSSWALTGQTPAGGLAPMLVALP
ncbi:MAG: hypothetical protein ABSG93_13615 [Solirubrobacteraceae bacterium]|jgi:hypothetical protein